MNLARTSLTEDEYIDSTEPVWAFEIGNGRRHAEQHLLSLLLRAFGTDATPTSTESAAERPRRCTRGARPVRALGEVIRDAFTRSGGTWVALRPDTTIWRRKPLGIFEPTVVDGVHGAPSVVGTR